MAGSRRGVWAGTQRQPSENFRRMCDGAGLKNMEPGIVNVCYQNAEIQSFFATKALSTSILRCNTSHGILGQLKELFKQMTASSAPVLDTLSIQPFLPAEFRTGKQQDTDGTIACGWQHCLVLFFSNMFWSLHFFQGVLGMFVHPFRVKSIDGGE